MHSVFTGQAPVTLEWKTTSGGNKNKTKYNMMNYLLLLCLFFFYFQAQLVGGLTLSDLLDKPWTQVSSPLPPGKCLHACRA